MWENVITDIGMYYKIEWSKQEIKSLQIPKMFV